MLIANAVLELYHNLVAQLAVGKRLPAAVYLHAEAVHLLPNLLRQALEQATNLAGCEWNVVKFASDGVRISLLHYPGFFADAFPALRASTVVDLTSGKVVHRNFDEENPPILHRKELLLPQGHPFVPVAAALTRSAEELGLFEDSNTIGHRQPWAARLARLRLRVDGHCLVADHGSINVVQRHKTALTRYSLSTPMQALWRHGFLNGKQTVFDYGCGRGDDVRGLQAQGIDAVGWDPHYVPNEPKRRSAIVNLGFVLNVIEAPEERASALHQAWALAEKLLVVSVLIGGRSTFERYRLFSDGVITARNTFQRYFTAAEFRDYLGTQLAREPIMLAPGIAFVFRDDADEQAFFARRSTRSALRPIPIPQPSRLPRASAPKSTPRRQRRPNKWELHRDLVDAFWESCLELGRLPEVEEFERSAHVRDALGVPASVLKSLLKERGDGQLVIARAARRDDLLVFLALNLFEGRKSFGSLPDRVRYDVKGFFGSFQSAQTEAQALLFSAGDTRAILESCRAAAARELGFLDGTHSLQIHASLTPELPALLRVYLGCAARLYGDLENADVVKIHIQSGKVSLMLYDDFHGRALPQLIERVKINLRRQQIEFFEYGTKEAPAQPLYLKSRFMRPDFVHYDEQVYFDEQLKKLNLDLSGHGPASDVLVATLERARLVVVGFELAEVSCSP